MASLKHDIFISYQWEIQERVKKLYEFLSKNFKNVFMDIYNLNAHGTPFFNDLANSIVASKLVVCCITKAYQKSINCNREIHYAVACKKPLVIIMFEDLQMNELEGIGLIIAQLLRINLFQVTDVNVIDSWNGPKSEELINGIQEDLAKIPNNAQPEIEEPPNNLQYKDVFYIATGTEIKIYDAINLECIQTFNEHKADVKCLELLDFVTLASGADDGSLFIWDLKELKFKSRLVGHAKPVRYLKLMADFKMASGDSHGEIIIWDISNGSKLVKLKDDWNLYAMEVLNGKYLATVCCSSKIRVWNVDDGSFTEFNGEGKFLNYLQLINPELLLCANPTNIYLYELDLKEMKLNLSKKKDNDSTINCLRAVSDELIIFADCYKTLIWNFKNDSCKEMKIFEDFDSDVSHIVMFNSDLLASLDDNKIETWDFKTLQLKGSIEFETRVNFLLTSNKP